jgi:hypothetical protein
VWLADALFMFANLVATQTRSVVDYECASIARQSRMGFLTRA